jgi:hypothetical protein
VDIHAYPVLDSNPLYRRLMAYVRCMSSEEIVLHSMFLREINLKSPRTEVGGRELEESMDPVTEPRSGRHYRHSLRSESLENQ